MKYYLDVKIKPDSESRSNVILNELYTRIHKSLSVMRTRSIGVSFPNYDIKLGDVIRIHGNECDLTKLRGQHWIHGLIKVDVGVITPVPDGVGHRTVSRRQSNMTASKLRRLIKRGSISGSDIATYKAKMFTRGLDSPYLEMQSASNNRRYRRFIEFGNIVDNPVVVENGFDQFGMGKEATIPWF